MISKKYKKTTKVYQKLFVFLRLPILFLLLFVVAYFVLTPGILKLTGSRSQGGVPVIPVDGTQIDISLGPAKKYFNVDVASKEASRQQGLSGRSGLDQSQGMLFIFDEPSTNTCFWMKDMQFEIDILWFDENLKLVHIKHAASPASYPAESFCPPAPSKYVIEVAAGNAERLNLKLGDGFTSP